MPHIFISYAKIDTRDLAMRLYDALNAVDGLSAWMDDSLTTGRDWARKIQRELDRADLIVVLLSPEVNRPETASQSHSFTRNAIDYALKQRKPMLPVMAQYTSVPVQIRALQYVDVTRDADGGVARIREQILKLFPSKDGILSSTMKKNPAAEITATLAKQYETFIPARPIPNVFLSYSRKDTEMMRRVRDDLKSANLSLWVDEEGLQPGTPQWEREIRNAIEMSDFVIVILSPDAEQSIWVAREIALAETLKRHILPLLVRGIESNAIPFRLMTTQYIDARNDYHGAIKKMLKAILKEIG